MVKFCIKNSSTGTVRSECFKTRAAARRRCAQLNRVDARRRRVKSSSKFTVATRS